jgi:DNA-directed RNA polymerase subunit RPC12/RpoP
VKEYIFHEQDSIEAMMFSGCVDSVNINRTIKKLARYNYYIKQLSAEDSYNAIVDYMNNNYPYFSEVGSYSDINGCIRDAEKSAWKNIDSVIITKKELETISALNDIRQEKIAFVLLADAKYDNAYKQKNINLSYLSNSDLYRMARVTMPAKERSMFLHFLYANNLVEVNINPTTTHKKLLYMDDSDGEVGLVLTENNYKELAFTYLNWKNGGGYKECKSCGRLFRTKKEGNQVYCKKCAPKNTTMEVKTIVCQECGIEVTIDAKDNKTIRCETCQHTIDKHHTLVRVKKYREKMLCNANKACF